MGGKGPMYANTYTLREESAADAATIQIATVARLVTFILTLGSVS